MIKYYLLIALLLPTFLYSAQGEIILGDTVYEKQNKQKEKILKIKPKQKKQNTIQEMEKKPSNKEAYIEYLNKFFKELLKEIDRIIARKIKEEMKLAPVTPKYENKLKMEINKLINDFRIKMNILLENNNYKRTTPIKRTPKAKPKLQIISVRIGNDTPKLKIQKNKLPIVITVISPQHIRKGMLKVYAKNMKNKKSYLIYQLNPFILNNRWAQDQNIWNGNYINKNKTSRLPKGKYQIFCSLKTKNKKLIRFWGKGNKNYYVLVM